MICYLSINLIQIIVWARTDLEIPLQHLPGISLMDAQHERGSNPRQTSSKSRINLTFHRDSILHKLLPLPSAHPSMASLSSI